MKNTFDAIVNPVIPKNAPFPGETAVLVSSESDLVPLVQGLTGEKLKPRKFFMSSHYLGICGGKTTSLAGPVMGAPYAVALMDTLAAWGVKRFIFLGWCGSISAGVRIGDIVVPERAFIDEGTSRHYRGDGDLAVSPAGGLADEVQAALGQVGAGYHRGTVWTTDALYRETRQKVRHFQDQGALAVEMEVSALISAARFRGVDICSVLVTSDRLHDMHWQPGFRNERFKTGRKSARDAILEVLNSQRES